MLTLWVMSIPCFVWILAVIVPPLPGDIAGMRSVGDMVAVAINMMENHSDMSTAATAILTRHGYHKFVHNLKIYFRSNQEFRQNTCFKRKD